MVAESNISRPEAPFQTQSFRDSRPLIVGPSSPSLPYPIRLEGPVCKGFGRGGKDLGCPTANLPDDSESVEAMRGKVDTGVYYGYAKVFPGEGSTMREEDAAVLPMVMSLGWNPYYKNERLTAEIHILHTFPSDFYGHQMKALVLGYIRPQLDYVSREALIEDIDMDKQVGLNCLAREGYTRFAQDEFFDVKPRESTKTANGVSPEGKL
ncbi:riboflavin kinase [Rhodocollybia butyracea]|uniref:Riboflavin kinase n=1 Tax=Rhodocollybia butyracea TaxID=206335 RepID=A0A9P5PQF5_9AGAR|nr:riboflavin kinase [Rhodocollybia butyracea]